MSTFDRTQASTPTDSTIQTVRDFKATPDLIWQAHTQPELVKRWMLGPPGWSMPICEMDVRPGGAYRWRWRQDSGGAEFGFIGKFVDVAEPRVLSQTQVFDPGTVGGSMGDTEALVSMTIELVGGATRLTTLMDYKTKEARDAAFSTGMTDGMEASYAALDAVIAEKVS